MTTALDYKNQKSTAKATRSFGKALGIYNKGQKQTSTKRGPKTEVTTDFNELIRLQIERSAKHQKASNRFIGWLGLGILLFLTFYLSYSLGVLS